MFVFVSCSCYGRNLTAYDQVTIGLGIDTIVNNISSFVAMFSKLLMSPAALLAATQSVGILAKRSAYHLCAGESRLQRITNPISTFGQKFLSSQLCRNKRLQVSPIVVLLTTTSHVFLSMWLRSENSQS